MAIPNSQLETWSKQGSITQSASTYASVKNALESTNSLYKDKSFEVFLQGSYGNDTNIYAESDVDVIIRLDAVFRGDIDRENRVRYPFSTARSGVLARGAERCIIRTLTK